MMKTACKLGDDQRAFIEEKVRSLGSRAAVFAFYKKPEKAEYKAVSLVDRYARHVARQLFTE